MPKAKVDKDGKPVLDDKGQPVMELTTEEQLADTNKKLDELTKASETTTTELKRTQALNRQLLTRSGMDVNRTVKQGDDGPDFSNLDFVNDPNGAVKAVVQAVVQNVQGVMQGGEAARQKSAELKAQFYRDNPDLAGFEDIVAVNAGKIQSEGTFNDDLAGSFAECAKRTRAWLKEKGFKASETTQLPNVLPGSNANDDKKLLPKKDEPFDEAKEQAEALADELKSRGELAGKRTTR